MQCPLVAFSLVVLARMATPLESATDDRWLHRQGTLANGGNGQPDKWAEVEDIQMIMTQSNARQSQGRRRAVNIQQELLLSERELQSSNCLVDEDGNFKTEEGGEKVSIYFFYQVEAIPGTTETMMNSVVLDDIEITLVDFMIPRLFDECRLSIDHQQATTGLANEKYVGMSANPADFVLRGCK